jgi:predicted nucleic acid-binding protein
VSVFVDTSALLAVLDADERRHGAAKARWTALVESEEALVTTSYVLVEVHALVQSRLGVPAVRSLAEDVLPVLHVHWIAAEDHAAAVASLLTAGRRRLSLVDCASFVVMRRTGVTRAFAYDAHFAEQGFVTLG